MTANPADNFVNYDEILPLLGPTKKQGDWLMAKCPVHDDEHASLGLSSAGVLRCFTGCSFKDVIAALRGPNYSPSPTPLRREPERLAALYEYKDMNGTVLAEKGRFERSDGSKTFRWRKPGVEGWPAGASGLRLADLPLYGVQLLSGGSSSNPVYFVEGEKACEACWAQGLIAVTHGGGAGTKDFGESLQPLAGRQVYLWPDNDAAGAEYMALLRAKLTVLGCNIRLVSVQLPPKGDAFDFFAAGHTIADIESASPSEAVVNVVGSNAVKVTLPSLAGPVVFSFEEMEKLGRQFDTELTVSCYSDPEPYTQQLNLNAHSSIESMRRDLNEVFGKQYGWTRVINKAFGLARDAYLSIDRGRDLADVPDALGELFLIPPLVMADGPTVFFGDGSTMKSYISAEVAYSCANGLPFCGMPTPHLTPLIVDYEDSDTNYKRRVKRLALARGSDDVRGIHYWEGAGVALADQLDGLKRYIAKHGIGLLIVDSAAPACGGDPLDVKSVLRMFGAIKKLGLPCIVIAHITKQMDTMKPYGVVFWHNEARRTWFVARVQDEESDEVDLGFYCRKVNDGTMPRPIAFHVSFSADLNGPVEIEIGSMERAPVELIALTSTRNQVWAALGGLPRSAKEIADETGLILKTVQRELDRGPFVKAGFGEPGPKGGPKPQLWGRQTHLDYPGQMIERVMDTSVSNPVQNQSTTPPKGVVDTGLYLGGVQVPNPPNESESTTCWKCGQLATAFDGEMRPVCREHNPQGG